MKCMKSALSLKMKEALISVLPVYLTVCLLSFTISPLPNSILMTFTLGTCFLIFGIGLFTLGAETAMTPIGEALGAHLTKSKKILRIVFISLLVGILITVSEPDLQILANQVPTIPNAILIGTVSVGVGCFLVIAFLRIFLKLRLNYLLLIFYLIVFILAWLVPTEYQAVAFDSGGVTTGPMTVPFIMAFGIGIASIRSDRETSNDTFGLVALCSIGPILSVLILGLIYPSDGTSYLLSTVPIASDTKELWHLYLHAFPTYLKEVGIALSPIALLYLIFQVISLRLPKKKVISILCGLVYTYFGLSLFLTAANVGFIPAGRYLGQILSSMEYPIIIPIGMILGYFIVSAEPAVFVLNKQVEEITSGRISARSMKLSLSIGVAISIGLSMFRTLTGISILWFLVPGYVIALLLTFFVPPIFTAIAFDSGGVASGPMTATFLLSLSIGACEGTGSNIAMNAFGIIALVAMTPLITIQVLGLIYRFKNDGHLNRLSQELPEPLSSDDNDIIDF